MAYIDSTYYTDTFGGQPAASAVELTRLMDRASDMIDVLTDDRAQYYDEYDEATQSAIKKATAYQTEYMVVNGDVYTELPSGSESIGSWSQSGGTSSKADKYSDMTIKILSMTGLCGGALDVGISCGR